MIATLRVLFCLMHDAQRTPKLCPRLLPTFKAWLLSTRSFCFNGELYGVFLWNVVECYYVTAPAVVFQKV